MTREDLEPIKKIFTRHFARLKDKLLEIETPAIIIDAVSREFKFTQEDIKQLAIKGNIYEEQSE